MNTMKIKKKPELIPITYPAAKLSNQKASATGRNSTQSGHATSVAAIHRAVAVDVRCTLRQNWDVES
jgi:hypothetical protein